jgi:quercetin dioxygenase-like cupin family protein
MTRRVVTGHDAAGKAVIVSDGPAPNVKVRPSGLVSTLLWVTDETPADVSSNADRAAREIGIPPPDGGSVFRMVDFPAGAKGEMHRTRSVDYGLVLEGEIDMLLPDARVRLRAGDVLVQQGVDHAWANDGRVNCRIAFILIDAKDVAA